MMLASTSKVGSPNDDSSRGERRLMLARSPMLFATYLLSTRDSDR
jgi:hypothetical protein